MFWLIMCQAVEDFYHQNHYHMVPFDEEFAMDEQERYSLENNFMPKFNMEKMSLYEQSTLVTYYMFTSMSTVGFGDIYPMSDFERIVCIFILVFGVAIFSMIMGNFISIIEEFHSFNDELDEGD